MRLGLQTAGKQVEVRLQSPGRPLGEVPPESLVRVGLQLVVQLRRWYDIGYFLAVILRLLG